MSSEKSEVERLKAENAELRDLLRRLAVLVIRIRKNTNAPVGPTRTDDFPRQQARVRELLGEYRKIGPNGRFGAAMIEATLAEAEAAQASGDIVRILRAYEALRESE